MCARLVLAVLTAEAEVLVDEEFANARIAGGEDSKTNNNAFCFSTISSRRKIHMHVLGDL